ncbi:MAG: lysophospholipid acyltransferase family protein [Calditrichia bacterium]
MTLRTLLVVLLLIPDTIICAILAMLVGIFNPYSHLNTLVMRGFTYIVLKAAGVKREIIGLEYLEPGQPYIVIANHQSHMDIPVLVNSLPLELRIISKKELFKIPFFGWGMKGAGILSVDRSNRRKAIETLKKAEQIVVEKKLSILAFPEGTRSNDGKLQPFKKGPFVLAINTGLPILPVSISGTRRILPKGSLKFRSGRVRVVVHPPIPTRDFKLEDRHQLVEQAEKVVASGFIENYNG